MRFEFGLIPVAGHQEFGQVFGNKRHGSGFVLLIEERKQLIGVSQDIREGGLLLPDVCERFGDSSLLKVLFVQAPEKCA